MNFEKNSAYFDAFCMFLCIYSLLQSLHASRAHIDMHNFANCSISPYSNSTFKLNGSAWPLSAVTRVDVEQDKFCIEDDPDAILDQYVGGEELKELILEEGNVFDNDLS